VRALAQRKEHNMANIDFALPPDVGAKPKRRREKFVPKPAPASPDRLDGRPAAKKRFEVIVSNIAADLGDNLTTAQMEIVEAFAGVTITVQDQNARLLLGQEVDLQRHAAAINMLMQMVQFFGVVRDHEVTLGEALLKVANFLGRP
jgi:hypothetical protein